MPVERLLDPAGDQHDRDGREHAGEAAGEPCADEVRDHEATEREQPLDDEPDDGRGGTRERHRHSDQRRERLPGRVVGGRERRPAGQLAAPQQPAVGVVLRAVGDRESAERQRERHDDKRRNAGLVAHARKDATGG